MTFSTIFACFVVIVLSAGVECSSYIELLVMYGAIFFLRFNTVLPYSYHFTIMIYLKLGADLKFPIILMYRNQFHAGISSLDCRQNDPYIDNNEGHG